MHKPPITVVTCTIYYKDKFLVIRRHDEAKKFASVWGFPGGKVEVGETVIGALRREITEETELELTDEFFFVDSYYYGDSLGLHFTAFATGGAVVCEPGVEYEWLENIEELQKLPRIPGIDFHIVQSDKLRTKGAEGLSLNAVDYTPDKYLN